MKTKTLYGIMLHRTVTQEDADAIVDLFLAGTHSQWARRRLERLRKPFLMLEVELNYLFIHVEYLPDEGVWGVDAKYTDAIRRLLIKG